MRVIRNDTCSKSPFPGPVESSGAEPQGRERAKNFEAAGFPWLLGSLGTQSPAGDFTQVGGADSWYNDLYFPN